MRSSKPQIKFTTQSSNVIYNSTTPHSNYVGVPMTSNVRPINAPMQTIISNGVGSQPFNPQPSINYQAPTQSYKSNFTYNPPSTNVYKAPPTLVQQVPSVRQTELRQITQQPIVRQQPFIQTPAPTYVNVEKKLKAGNPPKNVDQINFKNIPLKQADDFEPGCCSCFSPLTYASKK